MTDLALANGAAALAALVQSVAGIGFAMIAVPLLALIDLDYVPGPSLFAMMGLSLMMLVRGWRDIDRQGLPALMPGLAAGTVIGALSLGWLPESTLGLLFGGMVLTALAAGQMGMAPRRSRSAFAASGVVAGIMGTMAGIHGPALVILYQDAAPRTARATIALIFVIASGFSLLSLHVTQLFDRADMYAGLSLCPGVLAGYLLAIAIGHRIPDAVARRAMLGLAALSSLALIAKSLA